MKKHCSKILNLKLSTLSPKLGFTLIEVLLVTTIIGIIFGLGMAQYNKFNRNQIVVQAAQDLKNNLRFAQDKALAGEKPIGWCNESGEILVGHRLRFDSTTHYFIEAVCSNTDKSPYEVKSVNLPIGVTGVSGENALFKVLGRGVESATSFTISGFGETRTVSVSGAGEIKYED